MSTIATRLLPQAPGELAETSTKGVAWLRPLHHWHLLSLDAPTVAAVWVLTFSKCVGARPAMVDALALGVAVWLIYAADRLLDALYGSGRLEARHRFHAHHARAFVIAALLAASLLVVLVVRLPPAVRLGWVGLCLPMAVYAAAVHGRGGWRVPKEWIVAGMFAVTAALPAAVESRHLLPLGLAAALFAVACWLNCNAIARWEGESCAAALTTRRFRGGCLLLAVASVALTGLVPVLPALACAISAVCLCVLDWARWRMDAMTLRALADASLLTPLLLLPLFR